MKWLETYEKGLTEVFAACEKTISQFPFPLHETGLHYLSKFNVFEQESAKNYICYLLPFWLQDSTRLTPSLYRTLSSANIFGMLYFFIQDDIMDSSAESAPPVSFRTQLLLANLFYNEFMRLYRGLFPAESPFWSYFDLYLREWCEGVGFEQEGREFHINPLHIAKKASPVKLGSTAVLLLAGQEEQIPETSDILDVVLVTLQMMDDWADWEQDLADGSYNCLLSLIRSERQLPPESALGHTEVQQAVYHQQALTLYTDIAIANHQRLQDIPSTLPHLIDFHSTLVQQLHEESENIESGRQLLQHGGLNFILSTLSKK
ncbi:class 1 isoprenoid biosynthesis enzyme [Paenibacillus sp. JSM ZJ436]|uniref:class 1 isoprenoid biosynthesis enzyme n=1 Tax=Paenibacillus sp. JSM ZJ436 TaxID=3376190 RepID=UPI0037B47562